MSEWRQKLRLMRTHAGLRRDPPDVAALGKLDASALNAAAQNPDHSEAGRAAAAQALGAPAEPWRVRVPGFIKPADLAKGERVFFGFGRAVRKWSGAGVFLALLAMLVVAFIHQSTIEAYSEASADALSTWRIVRWTQNGPYVFGCAFALALLIWLLATALRRKPARVLLLRKFNVRAIGEALEKTISNEMRPYGHICSLSDKHIRRDTWGWLSTAVLSLSNPLAAAWLIVGAPIRFAVRLFDRSAMGPAVVLNARDYRNLAKRLRDRIGLNLQTALTSKEAFLVRTSDAWWKLVARLLLDSADVIVVDVSQVTAGTAWELEIIRAENAAPRCVFISLWGKGEEAVAAMGKAGFASSACHFYAPDGHMVDRHAFRAAMLGAVRATHAWR